MAWIPRSCGAGLRGRYKGVSPGDPSIFPDASVTETVMAHSLDRPARGPARRLGLRASLPDTSRDSLGIGTARTAAVARRVDTHDGAARTRRARGARTTRPGVVLLEVVLAVSLLLLAMALVGMAFRNGNEHVHRAERISRSMLLADRLLGELDIGVLSVPVPQEGTPVQETTGTFGGEAAEGISWRIAGTSNPDMPDVIALEVEVFEGAPDAQPDERKTIVLTHMFKALPKPINMQEDFGLTEEQTEQIKQAIPGGEQVFNPSSFNPQQIAKLDMDMLTQLLPVLIQAFGGEAVGGQLEELIRAAQRGDTSALQGLIKDAQNGQIPAPPGGATPAPGGPAPQPRQPQQKRGR